MKAVRFFLFFLFIHCSFSTLAADDPVPLKTTDVRKVMTQLFDYHVDKKKISEALLKRSLKIYIDQFDSSKSYLLANEVKGYLKVSPSLTRTMLSEYRKDKYTVYFDLHETIKKSIARAQSWRSQWIEYPTHLMVAAKAEQRVVEKTNQFAQSDKELKERHYLLFLKLISLQLKQYSDPLSPEQQAKLVVLCHTQLVQSENGYLGLSDETKIVGEKQEEHQVVLHTLKALAHSLDAHTAYYSPQEAYAMKVQLEKGMCGIGVLLNEGIEGVRVIELIEGGPAKASGKLLVGDTIVEVNGESVRSHSFPKVLEVMRGSEGSKLVLGIARNSGQSNETFQRVELVRKNIQLNDKRVDVSYEPHGDGVIGKVTLHSFYEGQDGISAEKDIRAAIEELQTHGPLHGLVFDLRDNTGGFLTQAVRVSGIFISSGVVVVAKYSDGSIKYYRAVDGTRLFDGPLVVLISRGSASATEIVAQTLQDYGVAVVVGDDRSYGKGTIQHQTVTSDKTNSFFKVTIGRYYTVSGRSTQIQGVKSDILVPTHLGFENIGEGFLDYPLPADHVAAVFEDPLSDVDPYARKWFAKYYLPTVQKQTTYWHENIGVLRENSARRLKQDHNFQSFLQAMEQKSHSSKRGGDSQEDLQMEESVRIVKDMIYLKQKRSLSAAH